MSAALDRNAASTSTAERTASALALERNAAFLAPSFDAQEYANAILKLETGASSTAASGDVGAALAGLNSSIEELNRALRGEITAHHSSLLAHAGAIGSMGGSLQKVRSGLGEVDGGVERLRRKISQPHAALSTSLSRLSRLQRASDLVRRANRFVTLARRLEVQLGDLDGGEGSSRGTISESGERALAEAALTLAEIETLRNDGPASTNDEPSDGDAAGPIPLTALPMIETHLPAVEAGRNRVMEQMEALVREGLGKHNPAVLATSLQTAYNLSVLPTLVASLVADLTEAVESRIRSSFDMASLAREVGGKDVASSASAFVYKSRSRNEPASSAVPQWTTALWARLERLVEDMAGCCIKVYTLEKVLKAKRDPQTQVTFLEEAMRTLESKPSTTFWTTLARAFETHARDAAKNSSFVQQTLGAGYPRLLRLFHEFFSKIAVHTDTVYSDSQQSPETVLTLRSISTFETLYVSRATNRMNEAATSAVAGGARSPPGVNDGTNAARVIINELDAARFDPLLVRTIARAAAKAIEIFVSRTDKLIALDYAATSLVGPTATPSQQLNAELVNALYHFWASLHAALDEHSSSVRELISEPIAAARTAYLSIVTPLLQAIRRDFIAVIGKIHRIDFNISAGGGGSVTSAYMRELCDKVAFVRLQILALYRVSVLAKECVVELGRLLFRTFVLHASIVTPITEAGKLKLTSDMTALEFSVTQMLSDCRLGLGALGDEFTCLRAFRPLLFVDDAQLADPVHTASVPTIVVLHQAILHSPVPLPTRHHGWSETEYVRWLAEHADAEHYRLIEDVTAAFERDHQSEAADPSVAIVRTLLSRVA